MDSYNCVIFNITSAGVEKHLYLLFTKKVCENYIHRYDEPLNIPITVITGTEEDMEEEDILLWQKETNLEIDFNRLEGKHFFIFKKKKEVMDIIEKNLSVNANFRKAYN